MASLYDTIREKLLGKGMAKSAADKIKSRTDRIDAAVNAATQTSKDSNKKKKDNFKRK